MDIIVKAKNCDIPARLKEEAVARVEHAARFFDRLLGVELTFSAEHNPRIADPAVVELTARATGGAHRTQHIRAQGAGADHRSAIDVAIARFERQLARYKARLVDQHRKPRIAAPAGNGQQAASPGDEAGSAWTAPPIVRTKQFPLQPMLPEDAALALELLDHEFYLFTNAATGACSVLYRRRDGNLGLIEGVEERWSDQAGPGR